MRWSTVIVFGIGLVPFLNAAQASSIRVYGFPELVEQANAAILAHDLTVDAGAIKMSVDDILFSSAPIQKGAQIRVLLDVPDHPRIGSPMPVAADLIKGERLVFLSWHDGNLSLIGAGLQSIWPQERDRFENVSDSYSYPGARDLARLTDLCRELRRFDSLEVDGKRRDVVAGLVADDDLFRRLAGLQLCTRLQRMDRAKYSAELDVASAFSLLYLTERDPHIYSQCVALMGAAPKSAALRRLLRIIEHPSVETWRKNSAFMTFTALSKTKGQFDFQHDTLTPDESRRQKAVAEMWKWLNEATPGLLGDDRGRILPALKSEDLLKRKVGRIWLESASPRTFHYQEDANADARAKSVGEIETWFETLRSGPGKGATPDD